jgi:signal peptidase II
LAIISIMQYSNPWPPQGSLVSPSSNARVIASSVVALVLVIDQLSKQWALTALGKVGLTVVLPGPVDLTLVLNSSSAFGLVPVSGELTRWGLTTLNLVVAFLLVRVVVRSPTARLTAVGLAFIIAGAIGNALDRIRFGWVIDLFNASKLGFVWIFNVADVSIDIGIALLLVATLLTRPCSNRLDAHTT